MTCVSCFNFRMLVEQLERVNVTQMELNAQIAFWINVYNALIMHVMIFKTNHWLFLIGIVTIYKFLLLFVGLFSIWNSQQLFKKVGLVP